MTEPMTIDQLNAIGKAVEAIDSRIEAAITISVMKLHNDLGDATVKVDVVVKNLSEEDVKNIVKLWVADQESKESKR